MKLPISEATVILRFADGEEHRLEHCEIRSINWHDLNHGRPICTLTLMPLNVTVDRPAVQERPS